VGPITSLCICAIPWETSLVFSAAASGESELHGVIPREDSFRRYISALVHQQARNRFLRMLLVERPRKGAVAVLIRGFAMSMCIAHRKAERSGQGWRRQTLAIRLYWRLSTNTGYKKSVVCSRQARGCPWSSATADRPLPDWARYRTGAAKKTGIGSKKKHHAAGA